MLKNAMDFNEPGSTIYKDAETLKLMMSAVMSDIMLASPSTNISKSDKKLVYYLHYLYLLLRVISILPALLICYCM